MKRCIKYFSKKSKFNFLLAGLKFYPIKEYGFYMTYRKPIIYLKEYSSKVSSINIYDGHKHIISENKDYIELQETDIIEILYTNGTKIVLSLYKDTHGFFNFRRYFI